MKHQSPRSLVRFFIVAIIAAFSLLPASAQTPPPSGALVFFRQVDQSLDKVDKMLGDEGAQFDKTYRSKEAIARLKAAQDGMETVNRRYGSKMDKDNPDLVSRNQRIADLEKKVATFGGQMSVAISAEATAQAEKDKNEAAEREAEVAAEKTRRDKAKEEKNKREDAEHEARVAAETARPDNAAEEAAAALTAIAPATAPAGAAILFSKSPLDTRKPANLTKSFAAGDSIYGLIQVNKTWRELYDAQTKTSVGIMIVMKVGDSETLQYITLKKPELIDSNDLVLDIAPDPKKMTAYTDPDIVFGEGKGNRKIGPIAFTYELAQLPAGKHTVNFFVKNYGDILASGTLEIEGSNFKAYADLHEKVKAASEAGDTLPAAGMVNKDLEKKMNALLKNAGWNPILRLVIIDKDWWVEGNTSRYLNVAAASQDSSGACYWCKLQFTQPKLITGGWGELSLTKTGIKRNIAKENVNK